jgi:hypothetical protein
MLHGPSWPIFMCPNCRATADLDAEVDEPPEEWQQLPEDISGDKAEGVAAEEGNASLLSSSQPNGNSHARQTDLGDPGDITVHFDSAAMAPPPAGPIRHAKSDTVPIPNASIRRTPSPTGHAMLHSNEGPITPRNDAGPWVFDGNPARVSQESTRRPGMVSLNAAAQAGPSHI